MDVAFVITELEPGGAERCLVKLALDLSQRGHCVNVVSIAPEPRSGRNELVVELRANGINPHFLDVSNYREFFRAKRRLRLLLSKIAPDIVQSFLFHANILCGKISKRSCWKLIAGLRVSEPRRLRQWMMRYQRSRFHRVVCVSDDVSSYAQRQLAFPLDNLVVIPNGIDLDRFTAIRPAVASELSFDTTPPLLTFIGRLHVQKGVDLIVDNAKFILQSCPQHHIAIVGDGSRKQYMQRIISAIGLEQRVHFYGYREDAAAILKASQLLLFPSRWEGMPNVVIEAMAAKKPIVACPADGVRALLSHAPQQIVEPSDWPATVIEFALDRAVCDDIGESNYTVVSETYQLSQMINQYEDLYHQILQPS
ncbi:MAG TPA: glycosyltransferase [Planctomycetaceae bacterium]|nr:glycosyltransferase [Planctomycetaceae bacterium]